MPICAAERVERTPWSKGDRMTPQSELEANSSLKAPAARCEQPHDCRGRSLRPHLGLQLGQPRHEDEREGGMGRDAHAVRGEAGVELQGPLVA